MALHNNRAARRAVQSAVVNHRATTLHEGGILPLGHMQRFLMEELFNKHLKTTTESASFTSNRDRLYLKWAVHQGLVQVDDHADLPLVLGLHLRQEANFRQLRKQIGTLCDNAVWNTTRSLWGRYLSENQSRVIWCSLWENKIRWVEFQEKQGRLSPLTALEENLYMSLVVFLKPI